MLIQDTQRQLVNQSVSPISEHTLSYMNAHNNQPYYKMCEPLVAWMKFIRRIRWYMCVAMATASNVLWYWRIFRGFPATLRLHNFITLSLLLWLLYFGLNDRRCIHFHPNETSINVVTSLAWVMYTRTLHTHIMFRTDQEEFWVQLIPFGCLVVIFHFIIVM